MLFAVNVTAVLPVTPSNLGVFQAACVAVLTGAYGVARGDALGYGIILQAVEIATAVIMGAPALVKEGMSWRDVRLRALHAAPVAARPRRRGTRARPRPERARRRGSGRVDGAGAVDRRPSSAAIRRAASRSSAAMFSATRVVEVRARVAQLRLQADEAVAHERRRLELDRVRDAVEDDVDHRARPSRAAPRSAASS